MQINLFLFATAFLLMSSPILNADTKSIADFKRGYFKVFSSTSGFHTVKTGLETLKDEIIVYNGYVNNDLYTDVVTFTKDRKTVNFYIYNDSKNEFENTVKPYVLPEGEYVQSIKFIEIDQSQQWPNVVLVSYKKQDSGYTNIIRGYNFGEISSRAELQQIKEYSYEVTDTNSKYAQEFFNFEIFEEENLKNYWLFMKDGKRSLIYWDKNSQKFKEQNFSDLLTTSCEGCNDIGAELQRTIPEVYTSAFIDLNQDCKSDIVLETVDGEGNRFLEFFYYYRGKFGFIQSVSIPKNFSLGTFSDINGNNQQDLTFFDNDSKSLRIFLNTFQKLYDKAKGTCLDSFQSIFSFPSLNDMKNQKFQINQNLSNVESLIEDKENRFYAIPRFGDLDLDGKNDLILNVRQNNTNKTLIFLNQPCEENTNIDNDLCRFFDDKKTKDQLEQFKDKFILQSSFFDFGERGKLGLFIQYKEDELIKIGGILNNFEIENYFLKAIGFYQKNSYQNLSGATFNIKKTELDGKQKYVTRTQSHNCNFNQLCLPFVHFGLGKINNYIEDFNVTINREDNASFLWTPIIPNSQLIVYFEPGRKYEWNLNIFINPTSAMFFIFISTVVVLVLIGIIILFLHCKEKKIEERFQMVDFNLI